MKKRILVSDPISKEGMHALKEDARWETTDGSSWSREELEKNIDAFEAIIVRSSTTVDQSLLQKATSLEVVIRAGTGVDNIDLPTAKENKVSVMNTPGTNAQAAAELTIALMLNMVRNIPQAMRALSEGQWDRKAFVGSELKGKVLGVVGMGYIGQQVARMAHGFGMKVVGFDPKRTQDDLGDVPVQLIQLKELQAMADIITFHASLNDHTRGMVDQAFFNACKQGVSLVNCARAELMVFDDLYRAIEDGQVGRVALDVLDQEPPAPDHPALKNPRIMVTPHIGASTTESQSNVIVQAINQWAQYVDQGVVVNQVH